MKIAEFKTESPTPEEITPEYVIIHNYIDRKTKKKVSSLHIKKGEL